VAWLFRTFFYRRVEVLSGVAPPFRPPFVACHSVASKSPPCTLSRGAWTCDAARTDVGGGTLSQNSLLTWKPRGTLHFKGDTFCVHNRFWLKIILRKYYMNIVINWLRCFFVCAKILFLRKKKSGIRSTLQRENLRFRCNKSQITDLIIISFQLFAEFQSSFLIYVNYLFLERYNWN